MTGLTCTAVRRRLAEFHDGELPVHDRIAIQGHLNTCAGCVDDLRGLCFGVWGLAFKPGTDDLREAPSLVIIDELLRHGATVKAFDPVAMPKLKSLWGERAGLELMQSPIQAAKDASALLVVTEWREFRSPDFAELRTLMREPVVIDGRNLFDPVLMEEAGFEYVGVGRGKLLAQRQPPAWAARKLAVA